jgi:Na+/melibiose symporter-like transporter
VGVYLASYNIALVVAGRYGGKVADIAVWRLPLGALGPGEVVVAGWRLAHFLFAAVGALAGLLVLLMFREPPRAERVEGAGLGTRPAPLLPTLLAVLRVPSYLVIAAVFVLAGGVVQATQFWLPRYLGDRFGLSLEEAGWQATAWVQAATVVGLFLGGKLGDWWAGRRMAGRTAVQMIGVATLVPALVVLGRAESLTLLAAPLLAYGFGVGLYQANLWTATFDVVDPAARATAVGLLNVISGVFGSWWNALVGQYQDRGGDLSTVLTALSVPAAVSLVLLGLNVKFFLPRDYRGPLRKRTFAGPSLHEPDR